MSEREPLPEDQKGGKWAEILMIMIILGAVAIGVLSNYVGK